VISSHLSPTVTLLVLLAGVLHAMWNAIAKTIENRFVASGLIGLGCAVVGAIALPLAGLPNSAALVFVLCSTTLHIAYTFALMQSYRLGDFGHTYPLARGTSPLLVAAGSWIFAGQRLNGVQLGGVLVVALALMALVFAGGRLRRDDVPGTVVAILVGISIAGYTIVDGLGVRHAHNAYGYIALLFVLQGPVLAIGGFALSPHDPAWRSPHTLRLGTFAGFISVAAYGIVIWAQDHGPFALVSALRETSVISAAIIATLIFHERFGWRRLPPSIAVVIGIVLMNL
jgi:drug/metabolite transporter (DMT)-like permease